MGPSVAPGPTATWARQALHSLGVRSLEARTAPEREALVALNCFPECLYEQQQKEILQPGRQPGACSVPRRGAQSSQGKHAPSAAAIFACVSN